MLPDTSFRWPTEGAALSLRRGNPILPCGFQTLTTASEKGRSAIVPRESLPPAILRDGSRSGWLAGDKPVDGGQKQRMQSIRRQQHMQHTGASDTVGTAIACFGQLVAQQLAVDLFLTGFDHPGAFSLARLR